MSVAEIVQWDEPGRAVVALRGEHDASNAEELSSELGRVVSFDDVDVVLDLSEVQFMGASTAGVIAHTRQALDGQHRRLTVQLPTRCAQRVLELCGLSDLAAS